ncbi:MAG: hypothetical protein KGY38_01870 [Desulfobacterales bacterium]|nr:hypothetical protein [Desulfobacterales bacterium]
MQIKLPWKEDFLELELPDSWRVHLPERVDISGRSEAGETELSKGSKKLKKDAEVAVFPDGGATYPDIGSARVP